uniref:Kazal-like domain-containing protein n=1 Tax=Anopheles dirus TaxID=7168 RepID=A0A182N7M1_9DIPT
MERSGRRALVGVFLVVALLVALSAEPTDGRRVRRHSPWLQRTPNAFALGKKFARNRPLSGATLALETNTDWPAPEAPVRTSVQTLELSAEVDGKPATRSRTFYGCMSNCLTLSQYNPVCGTDHTTYHNQYKLECANRCGAKPRVLIKKSGIC